jgi:hypothetical protein
MKTSVYTNAKTEGMKDKEKDFFQSSLTDIE